MKIYYNHQSKQFSRKLRNNSTLSEVLLWNQLKGRRMLGWQFMRQKPIGNYIVDFFCSKLRLIIEVDGDSHINKEVEDAIRQQSLEHIGLHFLRFSNEEVKQNMSNVLRTIRNYIEERHLPPTANQSPLIKGGARARVRQGVVNP